uniref:Pleckstrin homology domain containing, family G (with RhoGef domain) member 6 n=1 Tax=Amphiprion percula TaxID=161767 RepID=A0A3P8SVT9_AMPPE
MDPAKPSSSLKALNSGSGHEVLMDELRDLLDPDRPKDAESRETDAVNGTIAAEPNQNHRGSVDRLKFHTLGYQRRTKQKVVRDFTSVSKGSSAGTKPRAALRQVLFSQGANEKPSEDRGQLDVLKQELEAFAVPVSLRWTWQEENRGTSLENNWTDLVRSHATMSRMQRHQQEALWELIHTELSYINKLLIIRDLVIAALENLQLKGFLLEVSPQLLFSNLPSIIKAHQLFWQQIIFPMLQEVRRSGEPFDPLRLEAGCLQFHERFSSYQLYCWEEENNLEFSRRQTESNAHFLTYVQWVETHSQCERMRLGDMQAKPHQRITKYPLLLMAVLKNSQDPDIQDAVRGMLTSVNSFLESINDYLRLKDEELALSISAQRVEGYEVEGISEEIDKHVRELCRFDLTCPIRGTGPDVVRKLLLEENLKVRGRKDSKLEVVALLFSDVLLLTKVQKKGERLKMVRPPVALDRTNCIALKDGYSFVLVEVGELQSVMNVLILVSSTSESCSTWVSTIHQAKGTLRNLRQKENNKLENLKIHQPESKAVPDLKIDDVETEGEEEPVRRPSGTFVKKLTDELITPSINGSKEAEPPDEVPSKDTGAPFWRSQSSNSLRKKEQNRILVRQEAFRGCEWIEMGVRGELRNQQEDEARVVESQITNQLNVTWNHQVQSAPNLNHFTHRTAAHPVKYNTTATHQLMVGALPDVDYPTDENTSQLHHQPAASRETNPQSGDVESSPDAWSFSKNLRSPGLRRKRLVNTSHSPSAQMSNRFVQRQTWTSSNSYLSSNSDSESNLSMKRNSLPSSSSETHRVLKLSSLKPKQGMFWNVTDRTSTDLHINSEPELPDLNLQTERPKMKTQRSASIPNIIIDRGLHQPSGSLFAPQHPEDTPTPGYDCSKQPSPLEGLLERARDRDRGAIKRDRNVKTVHPRSRYPPSPSFSTTPSPPPSEGDRDTEWQEVELQRHRALTVSKGWKEQLVDGDEDDKRNSVMFADGVNVDWSGWCFDDDEVMAYLHPGHEGLMEEISRSLVLWNLEEPFEEGECCQV